MMDLGHFMTRETEPLPLRLFQPAFAAFGEEHVMNAKPVSAAPAGTYETSQALDTMQEAYGGVSIDVLF
jgi:hypothetical protein